jgi:hypothetical protein
MTHLRRFLIAGSLTLLLLGLPGPRSDAQPADETAGSMNARLAASTSIDRDARRPELPLP